MEQQIIIYQSKSGKIEFRGDLKKDTIWGTQAQISELFKITQPVVSRHIKTIFKNKEADKKRNIQKIHNTNSDKPVLLYSLDVILLVGYRTNSKLAIEFRKWATKILKQHLLNGWTINNKQLTKNYEKFQKAVKNVKTLLPEDRQVDAKSVLDLINTFDVSWFSLDAYDKKSFPKKGWTKKEALFTAEELNKDLRKLKQTLISKKQATKLFGQERERGSTAGIVGSIFQTFGGKDVYPSIEEKSAHLLYFMVKNHPFSDGNKRSGAFAFIWFLQKASQLPSSLTPEALTALTLLVAESKPQEKDKMIGLILLLLSNGQKR